VELDLNDFNPTVDKQDFIWGRGSSSEHELLTALKRQLNKAPLPLLDQADNYRSTKVDKGAREAASKAAEATATAVVDRGAEHINEQAGRPPKVDDPLPRPEPGAKAQESTLEITVRGEPWHVAIQLSDRPEDRNQWLEITERPSPGRAGARKLGIRISLTNPFTVRFASDPRSMAVLVRLAAGLALAELTTREAGGKNAGAVRRNLNELLLNVLADS
jgi:hypothetical protein